MLNSKGRIKNKIITGKIIESHTLFEFMGELKRRNNNEKKLFNKIFKIFQHSMIYFFHHYELPVIVQQAQLQQILVRRNLNNNNINNNNNNINNNNNNNNDNGQGEGGRGGGVNAAGVREVQVGNQQMNRENQQQAANEASEGAGNVDGGGGIEEQANNMFTIRGAYRRRVNHLVERLRNNFYNNVFGVGIISDNNNNNALRNQPGFNNLTRSLRLLNMIFPNRPILNVRIINVRSASAAATVADMIRNVENSIQQEQQSPVVVENLYDRTVTSSTTSTTEATVEEVRNDEELPLTSNTTVNEEQNDEASTSSWSINNAKCSDSNNANVMQSVKSTEELLLRRDEIDVRRRRRSHNDDSQATTSTNVSNEQC